MPSLDQNGVGECNHWYEKDGVCWYCGERKGSVSDTGKRLNELLAKVPKETLEDALKNRIEQMARFG